MASGLFFSSPLHPTSNSWQQPSPTFFTPPPALNFDRSKAFAQTSPSPLRTSKNANLMSSPLRGGKSLDNSSETSPYVKQNTENTTAFGATTDAPFTFTQQPSNSFSSIPSAYHQFTNNTHSSAPTDPPTITPSVFLSSNTIASTSDRPPTFQFSARAHSSSSPAHLLQSHTKDNRESRKRLFLDRLRSRRDNARTDRTTDQVLRMDFIREKRQMETDMARGWNRGLELDPDQDLEEDAEMSPVDEDRGLFELASEWEQSNREIGEEETPHTALQMDEYEYDEFSDGAYDEAFMEVLSQEVSGRVTLPTECSGGKRVDATDTDMDMS